MSIFAPFVLFAAIFGVLLVPRLVVSGLLFAVVLAALGCQARAEKDNPDPKAEATDRPAPVVLGTASIGTITETISVSSTIEAERQVTIHAESTGRLVDLTVEEGDKVKKGQLLARIRYDAQASSLVRANTSLDKARDDFNRAEQLFRDRVIGDEELQRARNTLDLAELDLRDRSRDMRNTKVTAPFAGTITKRVVTAGAFINSGAELLTIVDFDTLVARVFVPEKQLDRIRVDQVADVVGKAARGRRGEGTVQRIAPTIDAGTGTVKVTIALPPALAGPQGFLPGMYAEVTLTTDQREGVVLIPKAALVRDEEQTHVFVVTGTPDDGFTAKRVSVELGLTDPEQIEIRSGIQAGDQIIIAGQNGLKDGAKVVRFDAEGKPIDSLPVDAPKEG